MPALRGQNPPGLTQTVADRTENLFNGNVQYPDQPRRAGGPPLDTKAKQPGLETSLGSGHETPTELPRAGNDGEGSG